MRGGRRAARATYTAPVSDTTSSTDERSRISLSKSLRKTSAAASSDMPKQLPTPRTIDLACLAMILVAVASVARGLLLLGSTSTLTSYLVNANNKAGDKKKTPYGADQINADLHSLRQGTLVMGLVIAVALTLLVFAVRRARSASGSRWALLILMVFTSLPFYVVPISGFPAAVNVAGVVVGVAAIAAILLVFVPPPSQKYFRDCRQASLPPERRGQPRPSLFGPRRQRPGLGGPGGGQAAAARAAQQRAKDEAVRPSGAPKARAKVRADAEAVARGAELARSRAKASKSRRSTD